MIRLLSCVDCLQVLKMAKPYPAWICNDCGPRLGKWFATSAYTGPKGHCATMHYDTCDVCGKHDVPCTEPRDYGHLVDDWDLIARGNP
jgi:hypothetical protein